MSDVLIPVIVFVVALIATLWLRRVVYTRLERRLRRARWPADKILRSIRAPIALWCLIISAYLALLMSTIPAEWKVTSERGLWTVFLLSLTLSVVNIALSLITFYGQKRRLSGRALRVSRTSALVIILIITALFLWHIWDMPGSPLSAAYDWLKENWPAVLIPLAVFAVAMIAMLRLRRIAYERLKGWLGRIGWEEDRALLQGIKGPTAIWCLIVSAYLALAVSAIPPEWKSPTSKGLWSLILISVTAAVINIVGSLLFSYGRKVQIPGHAIVLIRNVTRIVFLVVAILMLLDIWGLPTSPILLLIAVALLAAALAFRDAIPNFFAGLQLSATQQVKVGDYVKLETGEEGYIVDISWNNTHIKSLDESIIIVPNSRLVQHTVINYGHPLKRASEPFRFNTRTHLTELTGLKAQNLRQLVDILRKAPDSVVYYHTHRFLEERHYLTPELSNDFAVWVSDALGDEVLGEALASVDTFGFPNLAALRDRLVAIMDEHLASAANGREAVEGGEFYFMKVVGVLLPTPYVAYDLREFVEALRKISLGSLYFHIFDARLRLGTGMNDFSIWLEKSLGDAELGGEIARLDPYTYTLEGLRLALIQTIEKRIK